MRLIYLIKAPINRSDRHYKDQSPTKDIEFQFMEKKPYASLVGSEAQVCIRSIIAFALSVLRIY